MTKYSELQKKAVAKYMRAKYMAGDIEGHEIVVALISMVKAERIKLTDVRPILEVVFFGNKKGVVRAILRAEKILDDELLDEIVEEVKKLD